MHQDLVRAFFEDVFTSGRADVCAQIVAPVFVEHALAPFGEQGTRGGPRPRTRCGNGGLVAGTVP